MREILLQNPNAKRVNSRLLQPRRQELGGHRIGWAQVVALASVGTTLPRAAFANSLLPVVVNWQITRSCECLVVTSSSPTQLMQPLHCKACKCMGDPLSLLPISVAYSSNDRSKRLKKTADALSRRFVWSLGAILPPCRSPMSTLNSSAARLSDQFLPLSALPSVCHRATRQLKMSLPSPGARL